MRKLGLWIAAGALAAGGLYYGVFVYPQQRFKTELDLAIRQLPPGSSAGYKDAHYAFLSGNATLRGVTFHRADPHGIDVTVDEVELTKPSLDFAAEWSKAAASPSTLAPEMALPVAAAISVKGMSVHTAEMSGTVQSTEVERLRVHPWALLHPGLPSILEAQAALLHTSQPPQLADILPLLKAESGLMLGMGYDNYALTNMKATAQAPATPSTPAYELVYEVDKMTGTGYDRGVLSDGTVEGMTMRGDPIGTVTLDKAVIAGWNFQKPLTQLLNGEEPNWSMLDGLSIGQVAYEGIAMQSPIAGPIALGGFALSNIGFSQGIPVSGQFSFTGFRMSRAQIANNPSAAAVFSQFGLDSFTLSFALGYRWDLDHKRLAVRDALLKVDELGALTLEAEISDASPSTNWQTEARLAHATLRYTDASLTERAFRIGATSSGADPAAVRQQMIAAAQQQGAAVGTSPAMAAVATAIAAFLGDPHVLTVELAPPTPIALSTLQAAKTAPPAELVSILGLNVTASQ
jgi:hypothetical protein